MYIKVYNKAFLLFFWQSKIILIKKNLIRNTNETNPFLLNHLIYADFVYTIYIQYIYRL